MNATDAVGGPAAGAATILIVDDEVRNRKLLEALLAPEGYLTRTAAGGEEALASIAAAPPDLILMDVMMPGMDGVELTILLKSDPATCNIPIIMVSAHVDRSARLAGLDAGAEEFLTKPVDRAELWLRVRNLLRLKVLSDHFRDHGLALEQQAQARAADLLHATSRSADLELARNESNTANLAKSGFLAAMSHEIRTPMNGVIGMIDVLQQTSLSDHQLEMVGLIRESAFSLLGIIEDILDFSKIEAGRLEIERAPVSLTDVAEKACGMLDQLASKKGVEFTLFIDPVLPAIVLGDALRLRQVLLNLVGNAIKFSSGLDYAGRVSVRLVPAAWRDDEVTVEIQVCDNGIGMDAETQARLFSSFTQADASTTRRFGGSGLGLVISRRLVDLMGGSLIFDSAPGQGATFSARLPFALVPAGRTGEPEAAEAAAARIDGLSCLVIGAADGLAEHVASYAGHAGARVERAGDLAEACAMLPDLPPGLWIWIIDCAVVNAPVHQLRTLADSFHHHDIRFVAIRRGSRKALHANYSGLVSVNGNVLTRRRLLNAIAILAGRPGEDERRGPPGKHASAFRAPSREEQLRLGRLILVAEDNETNQRVILLQLALLGFAADVADNGQVAFDLWRRGAYALLLTDLHMPEMDGYQLAARVRVEEQGRRRIPILALTANALKTEAARCRAAGMDDYFSKPLLLADLKAMLEKWIPSAGAEVLSSSAFEAAPVLSDAPAPTFASAYASNQEAAAMLETMIPDLPVDVRVLAALIGSDPAVIREFLDSYRTGAMRAGILLARACADGQAGLAAAEGHKLKSSSRAVGALALGQLCTQLEAAGNNGDMPALVALLPVFQKELGAVTSFIDAL
jgi:signal transduction histidine kinase/HPt (histidine-containing phosphotransfer) domain-containing protein